ncbi:MAG: polysaccharide biosynthesis tyrosine autokinase [bacterium]|nr:polysaccharide biosynthesis tyrosine autokinase [bacterium]
MVQPHKHKKEAIVSAKDLNLVFRVLKSNWWVPFSILPIFYAVGLLWVYRLTTVYKASTEFLIKSEDTYYKNNVLSDAGFMSNAYLDNSNETRIINSYDLSAKVIDKLLPTLQVSYFIVGKVKTTEQFNNMPFTIKVNAINPSFYERKFDLRVTGPNSYELTILEGGSFKVLKGQFGQEMVDLDLSMTINTKDTISESMAINLGNIFYQFSVHSREFLIENIRSNLLVENPEFTQILKVTLKDVIPERAILILDTLNMVYAQNKLQSKFDLNERTISYIDRQLNEITFSLKSIEDTMEDYKKKKSVIDLDWERTDFLQKIGEYDGQRSKLQLQLSALNDLEKYIIEDKDPQFLPPGVFVIETDGFMSKAVQELYSKQIELNRLYGLARETNPSVVELKAGIRKTKQDLLIYITNVRKATNQQIGNINKEILEYVAAARNIPIKQRDLINIQRKAAVSEQLYSFLLEKKASTKIARAGIVSDVKFVEEPRLAGIDSPDKGKVQKQIISVGIVISLLIILLRTFFFTKIKSVEQLKELTTLPLIGVLPFLKEGEFGGILVNEEPNSQLAESFRNFRTNLQYANVDAQASSFLVTSFLPGEGKTFTSANLAAVLAKTGKRTILLELDLHKPKIYTRFGIPIPAKGISTFISGQDSFEEIVSPTPIDNLFCLYAGPIPPNPSELILSQKLKDLIELAKSRFDYVIIDSPPIGLLSDSTYLIQYVDTCLFVLNTKSSTKKTINFLEDLIEDNHFKNVFLLLNGAKIPKRRYYNQGYGYNYGYGYGYGYGKGQGYRK